MTVISAQGEDMLAALISEGVKYHWCDETSRAKPVTKVTKSHSIEEIFLPTLLHLTVGPARESFDLAAWKRKNPKGRVSERDLSNTPLTFVDFDWIAGASSASEHHNENHRKALALSDVLVADLLEADEVMMPLEPRDEWQRPSPSGLRSTTH